MTCPIITTLLHQLVLEEAILRQELDLNSLCTCLSLLYQQKDVLIGGKSRTFNCLFSKNPLWCETGGAVCNKQRQRLGIIGGEIIKVTSTVKSISLCKSRFSLMHAKMQPELLRSTVWHHTASQTGLLKLVQHSKTPRQRNQEMPPTPSTATAYPPTLAAGGSRMNLV